jgi:3-hydroxybutyrate dehydrogenase
MTGSRGGVSVCACLRERRANIVFNGMGAAAEVDNERSAMENDFGVKSVDSPAEPNAAA